MGFKQHMKHHGKSYYIGLILLILVAERVFSYAAG